jgi:hypothetical protein
LVHPREKLPPRFFFVSIAIGRQRRVAATHSPNLVRRRPYHCSPRTRERAGPWRWASARAAAVSGANLGVSYFAKRGIENIERIIKR